jgi:hypothetical protein
MKKGRATRATGRTPPARLFTSRQLSLFATRGGAAAGMATGCPVLFVILDNLGNK